MKKEWNPIAVDYIQAHAIAGGEIFNCARQAAIMALQEKRMVRFVHNDKLYIANYKTIVNGMVDAPEDMRASSVASQESDKKSD